MTHAAGGWLLYAYCVPQSVQMKFGATAPLSLVTEVILLARGNQRKMKTICPESKTAYTLSAGQSSVARSAEANSWLRPQKPQYTHRCDQGKPQRSSSV
jgi:hypothetical protein